MIKTINPRKAAVIGCGFVGAATAFTLMQSRLFTEMVLLDAIMIKQTEKQRTFRMAFRLPDR